MLSAVQRIGLSSLLLVAVLLAEARADTWLLSDEAWARPREGAWLLQDPTLRAVVGSWMRRDSAVIVIHYPGGDEGEVWAGELRDWLVALGIPSSALRMQQGNARDDVLTLTLDHSKREQF